GRPRGRARASPPSARGRAGPQRSKTGAQQPWLTRPQQPSMPASVNASDPDSVVTVTFAVASSGSALSGQYAIAQAPSSTTAFSVSPFEKRYVIAFAPSGRRPPATYSFPPFIPKFML